ncbi:tRNA (adenosine(37)-N6)-threonylcarbamoyltransferase complex transferase subunit TsaD [Roseobacter sp.]|uniref:tRNA (adenosine(37)-N6)-threonylcarbamoyltransferase complex transferase subunit TsaD n=1 Tax=Roseobacter sp. TaxID=1907202 RepID=UPI00385BDF27
MTVSTTVLGIESSCDDTAAAVLRRDKTGKTEILSSVLYGQSSLHAEFGGVVPEIAARAHAEMLDHCVEEALAQANTSLEAVDFLAVTAGPGLIGGVVSGVMCAKGLSVATGAPLYGVNHLAGHALTPRMTDDIGYPYLMLLVSGGHCQFLVVRGPDDFDRLGGTIDDAPGEAFDKIARLVGLQQPGGPAVERAARKGDANIYTLPRPLLDRQDCDLSFSGLKTAVLRARNNIVAEHGGLPEQARSDLCAGFQAAVVDVLAEKTSRALRIYLQSNPPQPALCVAGGVAANGAIRMALERVSKKFGADFIAPPIALCTDNAAMIAFAALEQMADRPPDDLTLSARPRWPLDHTRPAMLGSGKKGAKA